MSFLKNLKQLFGSNNEHTLPKRRQIPANVIVNVNPEELWELNEVLGDGAFGKVYKAVHIDDKRVSAAKVCTITDDDELEGLFVEIDILSELSHPNIISLLHSYFYKKQLWMLLEFCGGGAIDSIMIELDRGLNEAQISHIARGVLHGLGYLHQHRVIHRDIKAGNILITLDLVVKLIDFGVSAINKELSHKHTTFIGTPFWMAPEVIACETSINDPYDYLADIWSFGITMIELGQKEPPYNELNPVRAMLRIQKYDPPFFDHPKQWTKEFKNFTRACLKKEPSQRATTAELLQMPFIVDLMEDTKQIRNLLLEYKADVIEGVEEELEYPESRPASVFLDTDMTDRVAHDDHEEEEYTAAADALDFDCMGSLSDTGSQLSHTVTHLHPGTVTTSTPVAKKVRAPPPPPSAEQGECVDTAIQLTAGALTLNETGIVQQPLSARARKGQAPGPPCAPPAVPCDPSRLMAPSTALDTGVSTVATVSPECAAIDSVSDVVVLSAPRVDQSEDVAEMNSAENSVSVPFSGDRHLTDGTHQGRYDNGCYDNGGYDNSGYDNDHSAEPQPNRTKDLDDVSPHMAAHSLAVTHPLKSHVARAIALQHFAPDLLASDSATVDLSDFMSSTTVAGQSFGADTLELNELAAPDPYEEQIPCETIDDNLQMTSRLNGDDPCDNRVVMTTDSDTHVSSSSSTVCTDDAVIITTTTANITDTTHSRHSSVPRPPTPPVLCAAAARQKPPLRRVSHSHCTYAPASVCAKPCATVSATHGSTADHTAPVTTASFDWLITALRDSTTAPPGGATRDDEKAPPDLQQRQLSQHVSVVSVNACDLSADLVPAARAVGTLSGGATVAAAAADVSVVHVNSTEQTIGSTETDAHSAGTASTSVRARTSPVDTDHQPAEEHTAAADTQSAIAANFDVTLAPTTLTDAATVCSTPAHSADTSVSPARPAPAGESESTAKSAHVRKKTRYRTRRFEIDGVMFTTHTQKVFYECDGTVVTAPLARAQLTAGGGAAGTQAEAVGNGRAPGCSLYEGDHYEWRRQQLREIKKMQKLEQAQFRDLNTKSKVALENQKRKSETEVCQLSRQFDSDFEALQKQQKSQLEKIETQQETERRNMSKKIRNDQEKDWKVFRDSLKQEHKLFKQETQLIPRASRRDTLRDRKSVFLENLQIKEVKFAEHLKDSHDTSIDRLLQRDRQHVAITERQFLVQRHQLRRSRETALWDLEERHIHELFQLERHQIVETFFLQRHHMLLRHDKELEHVRKMNARQLDVIVRQQQVERRALPKRIRAERKARELMFRESMRVNSETTNNMNLADNSAVDDREKLKNFLLMERKRYKGEEHRFELKHKRKLEEMKAHGDAIIKELEQLQNEKRRILMKQESVKVKALEDSYRETLSDWKNSLKARKQTLDDVLLAEERNHQRFHNDSILRDKRSSHFLPPNSPPHSICSASSVSSV